MDIKKNAPIILVAVAIILGVALLYGMVPVFAGESKNLVKVPEKIVEISEIIGTEYGIAPELLQAVAFKESSFRPRVTNGTCIGLMQINEPFHRERMERLGVTDLFDPEQNMRVAADYIIELKRKYHCVGIVLMRYNGIRNPEAFIERTGRLSDYAESVLELSAALERENGE